jgi:mannosyltransferase
MKPEAVDWLHGLILLILAGGTLAIRLHALAWKPFWFDECFSVALARMDWRSFLHMLWWREANMSLYYVMLRGWMHWGENPFFIRSLSVVLAVATLPALYWLARVLYDRRVALMACAFFTWNGFDVRYSQEARSYALFLLLAALSSGFLLAFLQEPRRLYRNAYIATSALAVYAHFYVLLLLAAHRLVLKKIGLPVTHERKEAVRADLRRAWIAIAVAVLPLIIFIAKTGAGPIRWIQRPGFADLLRFCAYFSGGIPFLCAAACLLAVVPLGKRLWARDQSWEIWRYQFLSVWLLFPIALTLLLSVARPVFFPRYMIFCLPALLILMAAGVARVGQKWQPAVALGIMLVLSARMIPFVYSHDFEDERDGAGVATDFILDHAHPGDGVIFHIPQIRIPYEFFRSLRASGGRHGDTLGPEILYPRHGANLNYLDFKSKLSADQLRSAVAGHARVWVVLMYNGPKLPDPTAVLLKQQLPESYARVERWEFPRVELLLYSK